MKKMLIVLFVFVSIFGFSQKKFTGCANGTEKVTSIHSELEKEVLRLVNIERKNAGLSQLQWHEQLVNAARYHAFDMANENYFDHDSHDRLNGSLKMVCETFDRIKKFYTDGFACAENISAGRATAQATVEGWMNSPGHKANILNPDAKFMGVGYYNNSSSDYNHYCVQCFGY